MSLAGSASAVLFCALQNLQAFKLEAEAESVEKKTLQAQLHDVSADAACDRAQREALATELQSLHSTYEQVCAY